MGLIAERCGGTPGNPRWHRSKNDPWHIENVHCAGFGRPYCCPCPGCPDCKPDAIPHLMEVNRNLRNRIAELEAALKPFAVLGSHTDLGGDPWYKDDRPVMVAPSSTLSDCTIGDLRRAATVLKEKP